MKIEKQATMKNVTEGKYVYEHTLFEGLQGDLRRFFQTIKQHAVSCRPADSGSSADTTL